MSYIAATFGNTDALLRGVETSALVTDKAFGDISDEGPYLLRTRPLFHHQPSLAHGKYVY